MTPPGRHDTSLSAFERFMDETRRSFEIVSGQIAEIRSQMVTRAEYNTAHIPLIRIVDSHSEILKDYCNNRDAIKKWGLRMLIAILIAALFSPHSAFVFAAFRKIFGE